MTIAGSGMMLGGLALTIAGGWVLANEPFYDEVDGDTFASTIIGSFMMILPGVALASAGMAVLIIGRRRPRRWARNTRAWLGPGTLHLRTI